MSLSDLAVTTAPSSKWRIYTATDTATECTDFQLATMKLADKERITYDKDGSLSERGARVLALALQLHNSQCIASDDPRLKEKYDEERSPIRTPAADR